MKNKILFINACQRENSRTEELARYLLNKLEGEKNEIDLFEENIQPLDVKGLEKRNLHDTESAESAPAPADSCIYHHLFASNRAC